MTIEQAAIFLASSILAGLGFIVVFAVILVINNLLHSYWKPFHLYRIMNPDARFAEPYLDNTNKDKK